MLRVSSVMSCKGSRVHSGEGKYYTSRPEKDLLLKVQREDAALLLPAGLNSGIKKEAFYVIFAIVCMRGCFGLQQLANKFGSSSSRLPI